MNFSIRVVIVLMLTILVGVSCISITKHEISAKELETKWDVLGILGFPMGWVVRVDAILVDGASTRKKEFDGRYLLEILKINGRKLSKPIITVFSDTTCQMSVNYDDRYAQVDGKPKKGLTSSMIEQINKNYVGQHYDLLVYETGRFTGPRLNMVPNELQGQGEGFGFETSIVIIKVYGQTAN